MTILQFNPGFRLSRLDIAVLVIAAVGMIILYPIDWGVSFCFLFVICHFFLFCNVIRLPRPLELTWAAVFIILASTTLTLAFPGWLVTIVISLLVTVNVVIVQLKSPSYQGVAWQKLNPKLPEWFQRHCPETVKSQQGNEPERGNMTGGR